MNYKNLEIWQLSRDLAIDIHKMTLTELPKIEKYEGSSQIRRSSKSVKSNIVEGYGRKRYQQEYLRFLTFSISSNDETIDHLETLHETGSLTNKDLYHNLHERLNLLGKKINIFMKVIQRDLNTKNNITKVNSQQPAASSQQPAARSQHLRRNKII